MERKKTHWRVGNAVDGAARLPLTDRQKGYLMANYVLPAYMKAKAAGLAGADFDEWRREEVFKACGKPGLTKAWNNDFNLIEAHFLRVMGRDAAAAEKMERHTKESWRQAAHVLQAEMERCGDVIERPADYCREIARDKFKRTDSRDLTGEQLWYIVFDLRRAAQARRGKATA